MSSGAARLSFARGRPQRSGARDGNALIAIGFDGAGRPAVTRARRLHQRGAARRQSMTGTGVLAVALALAAGRRHRGRQGSPREGSSSSGSGSDAGARHHARRRRRGSSSASGTAARAASRPRSGGASGIPRAAQTAPTQRRLRHGDGRLPLLQLRRAPTTPLATAIYSGYGYLLWFLLRSYYPSTPATVRVRHLQHGYYGSDPYSAGSTGTVSRPATRLAARARGAREDAVYVDGYYAGDGRRLRRHLPAPEHLARAATTSP